MQRADVRVIEMRDRAGFSRAADSTLIATVRSGVEVA
jgi:hypothetical protein